MPEIRTYKCDACGVADITLSRDRTDVALYVLPGFDWKGQVCKRCSRILVDEIRAFCRKQLESCSGAPFELDLGEHGVIAEVPEARIRRPSWLKRAFWRFVAFWP